MQEVENRRRLQAEVRVGLRDATELDQLDVPRESLPMPTAAAVHRLLIEDAEQLLKGLQLLLERLEHYRHTAMDWREYTSMLDSFKERWGGAARLHAFFSGYARCRYVLCCRPWRQPLHEVCPCQCTRTGKRRWPAPASRYGAKRSALAPTRSVGRRLHAPTRLLPLYSTG